MKNYKAVVIGEVIYFIDYQVYKRIKTIKGHLNIDKLAALASEHSMVADGIYSLTKDEWTKFRWSYPACESNTPEEVLMKLNILKELLK